MSFLGTRQISLTRLGLIGPGQKWVAMRLGLSAGEKRSTLPLKGERDRDRQRDLACNSTAVLTMESHWRWSRRWRAEAWLPLITIHLLILECELCRSWYFVPHKHFGEAFKRNRPFSRGWNESDNCKEFLFLVINKLEWSKKDQRNAKSFTRWGENEDKYHKMLWEPGAQLLR